MTRPQPRPIYDLERELLGDVRPTSAWVGRCVTCRAEYYEPTADAAAYAVTCCAEVHRWEQIGAERDRLAAEQRSAIRREAMDRPCSYCGADPGRRCKGPTGIATNQPHAARFTPPPSLRIVDR